MNEKKIALVSFTGQGRMTLLCLKSGLEELGYEVFGFEKTSHPAGKERLAPVNEGIREWTGTLFSQVSALIYIGAAGIAVRAVAPYLRGKDRDPAVLSIDEAGRFAIPLLSGHLGGANELAGIAARILGAIPVITTATDLNRAFAVDLFAKRNSLAILNLDGVKGVSASLLSGREVGFFCELPVEGKLPDGFVLEEEREWNVSVTPYLEENERRLDRSGELWPGQAQFGSGESRHNQTAENHWLCLVPRMAVLGLGCKRGAEASAVAAVAGKALEQSRLHPLALAGAATIDLKKEEAGLLQFAEDQRLSLAFYPADELGRVQGEFYESEFVKNAVGVSGVCERAAVLDCEKRFGPGNTFLAAGRNAGQGVTAAVAARERTLYF